MRGHCVETGWTLAPLQIRIRRVVNKIDCLMNRWHCVSMAVKTLTPRGDSFPIQAGWVSTKLIFTHTH